MKKAAARTTKPEPVPLPTAALPIETLWYMAMALTAWSFGYTIMRGSDLWWHIAGGRWMVENRALWVRDPYSYSAAGQYWLNDAWLSDVLLYLWVQAFGMESLALWKWGLIVLTFVLLFRLLNRLHGDRLAAYAAATLGAAIGAAFLDVRPQLYSFLCWVILLEGTLGRDRPKAWLPLLMWIWVNLHASFLLGLITLPLALLPAYWSGRERRRLVLLASACVIACLINPNGAEVVTRPLRYALDATSPFRTLGEWIPPFEPGGIQSAVYPYGIAVYAIAVVVLLVSNAERRRSPLTWAELGISALALAMSLRSRRFVPFFGLAQSLVVAPALAGLLVPLRRLIPPWSAPVAAVLLALVWLFPYPRSLYAFDYMTAEYEFPVETIHFINANQLSGNVFALYNWGGYIHLHTGGRMKVFIDGRSETVYSDETFIQYMRVLSEGPGWQGVIERSGADFVLWPRRQSRVPDALVASGNWRLLYTDYGSVLLARTGVATNATTVPPETSYQLLARGYDQLLAGQVAVARESLEKALTLEPHLQPACTTLVQANLIAGDLSAGEATVERCRRIYPNPDRDRMLSALLEKARRNPDS